MSKQTSKQNVLAGSSLATLTTGWELDRGALSAYRLSRRWGASVTGSGWELQAKSYKTFHFRMGKALNTQLSPLPLSLSLPLSLPGVCYHTEAGLKGAL